MNDRIQQLLADAPPWAREPAVQIGAAVIIAWLLLWLLSRLFRSRPRAEEEIVETMPVEDYPPVVRPITPPPVTPPPPPIAEEPLIVPPVPEIARPAPEPAPDTPDPEPAPEQAPEPEPVPEPMPEPAPATEPEPASPYIPEEAPEPAVVPEPVAEPEPVAKPAPMHSPAPLDPMAATADDLTRMKGVGPRLADRLNSLGIASFAQIAALTPEDADALDARLGDFQGRIHRDRWIEQAGYLARGDITGFEEVFGRL